MKGTAIYMIAGIALVLYLTGGTEEIIDIIGIVDEPDYRNAYGILWRGDPCENLAYAHQMGYDYVNYQTDMEDCTEAHDMYFYIQSPDERSLPTWQIDLNRQYTPEQIARYEQYFALKDNSPFPDNIASGWWFSSTTFRPISNFQKQTVIDESVADIIGKIENIEAKAPDFKFGGFSWDVPDVDGDFWTGQQSAGGKGVPLSYWNPEGLESTYAPVGTQLDYPTYTDGVVNYRIKLFNEGRKINPDMKVWYEPYKIYGSYVSWLQQIPEGEKINGDFITQEDGDSSNPSDDVGFAHDNRILALVDRENAGSSTPDTFLHSENLRITGNAGITGTWFTWFGRFGGTGDMPNYNSITEVPDRLKLIRVIPGWDNLNKVKLEDRSYDSVNYIYSSPNSYADLDVIYSRHPDTDKLFVVVLDKDNAEIKLNAGETVESIMDVNGLFQEKSDARDLFSVTGDTIKLLDSSEEGNGFIIALSES